MQTNTLAGGQIHQVSGQTDLVFFFLDFFLVFFLVGLATKKAVPEKTIGWAMIFFVYLKKKKIHVFSFVDQAAKHFAAVSNNVDYDIEGALDWLHGIRFRQ